MRERGRACSRVDDRKGRVMKGRLPVAAIVTAGVGLGFTGDILLRAPGEPGLNVFLFFTGLAASIAIVSLQGGARPSREASLLISLGVLCAAGLVWRGSELLRFAAFVAAATTFALAALHGGRAWLRRGTVSELIEAVAASGAWSALGAVRLFQRDGGAPGGADDAGAAARSVARTAVTGALLATVPLVVFGALFVSADPVFAGVVEDFVRVDLQLFASHLVVGAILSWLACGYLTGFTRGTRVDAVRDALPRPSLGAAEVAVALGLVDLLFLAFVVVQFRYLFGGAAWVEVTPGVTYAAYAREGFFQLVVASALGLPWLLAAEALLGERDDGAGRWTFRVFAGAQLLLLLAIVASAVQRMRAYLDAYGLTEARFVATAVLAWLALLLLWFGATVLRGRRARFAFGGLVSTYGLLALLLAANPAAYAARSHLDRASSEGVAPVGPHETLDTRYLASLGSDAAPVLVARLDELGEAGGCRVARSLLDRWGGAAAWDWRSWNAADARARKIVADEELRLRAVAKVAGGCE